MENALQFFKAIREGSVKEVNELLHNESGLLQSRDQRGSTPLILATYYNQYEITELLLAKGAKINEKDGS